MKAGHIGSSLRLGTADSEILQRRRGNDRTAKLRAATAEPAFPLQSATRNALESRLGRDFSHVRVHSGAASALAARELGARAFALGRDIYLGAEAHDLTPTARTRLLAHEAIHTIQQGARTVAPATNTPVGHPGEAAEKQAEALADSVVASPSPVGFRPGLARAGAVPGIASVGEPRIQRDLTGERKSTDGKFDLNLKTIASPGGKSGLKGTIQFTPDEKAPDSKSIRLLQIVRDFDTTKKADWAWKGSDANLSKVQTTADKSKGVEAGYFVDHKASSVNPRAAKTDAAVSPYYRDYWPNATSSKDGSKAGKTIQPASLWDFPGFGGKLRYSFETAAKAADTGYVYATLTWGFTLDDPAKGSVTGEYADAHYVASSTFGAALEAFNKFYKNPGSSTAP